MFLHTFIVTLKHLKSDTNSLFEGVTQLVPSLPVNGTICPFESSFANGSTVLNCEDMSV